MKTPKKMFSTISLKKVAVAFEKYGSDFILTSLSVRYEDIPVKDAFSLGGYVFCIDRSNKTIYENVSGATVGVYSEPQYSHIPTFEQFIIARKKFLLSALEDNSLTERVENFSYGYVKPYLYPLLS